MRLVFSAAVLLLSALALADQFASKTEEEFVKTSDLCFKEQKVPQSYKTQFDSFVYADEPIAQEYLRCIWLKMELWDDATGFGVEHIADLYKDKANTEELIPVLSACNQNKDQDPPLKWLYRGFQCILESRVGGWFKEDVKSYISKQ